MTTCDHGSFRLDPDYRCPRAPETVSLCERVSIYREQRPTGTYGERIAAEVERRLADSVRYDPRTLEEWPERLILEVAAWIKARKDDGWSLWQISEAGYSLGYRSLQPNKPKDVSGWDYDGDAFSTRGFPISAINWYCRKAKELKSAAPAAGT